MSSSPSRRELPKTGLPRPSVRAWQSFDQDIEMKRGWGTLQKIVSISRGAAYLLIRPKYRFKLP
jgi:hypothetical protein